MPRQAACRFMPRPLLAVPLLLVTGCISLYNGRTVSVDPLLAEDRGESVFAEYGLPVVEFATDGRVTTGVFRADEIWASSRFSDRVTCQFLGARDPIDGEAIELSATLRVSYRTTGIRSGTRLSLGSRGRTIPEDGEAEAVPCRLSDAFTEELLAAVAGDADLGIGPPPTVRLPGVTRVPPDGRI